MTTKRIPFKWVQKLPGATTQCPWCGKQMHVMVQWEINPKSVKAYKTVRKEVLKDGGPREVGEGDQ